MLGRELSDAFDAWWLTASLSNACAFDTYTSQRYHIHTRHRMSPLRGMSYSMMMMAQKRGSPSYSNI
jgi:hypothetical protein